MCCIQVIVSDKTGTLTSNKLTVAHVWVDNQIGEIDTSAEQSPGVSFDTGSHSWKNMARVAVLCNASQFKVIKYLYMSTNQSGHQMEISDAPSLLRLLCSAKFHLQETGTILLDY